MQATMSILGLYNYDNNLFANLAIPTGLTADDKTTLINNLLAELAELEIVYPDPVFMKSAIGFWSAKELPSWERYYAAATAEYNPIENYNRMEAGTETVDATRTHSGTDTSTNSGTDTTANTGTDTTTNNIAAYDSSTLQTHDTSSLLHGHTQQLTHGHTQTLTHGHTQTVTHGLQTSLVHGEQVDDDATMTRRSTIHGNIGVTTSQQMLEQEIAVSPKLNMFSLIIDSFKNRFCLMVY